MAIQDKVVIDACAQIVENVTALLTAFDNLEAVKEHIDGAEIDLSLFADVLAENGDTQHADAAIYEGVLEQIIDPLVEYLKVTEASGKTFWNWLQTVRK